MGGVKQERDPDLGHEKAAQEDREQEREVLAQVGTVETDGTATSFPGDRKQVEDKRCGRQRLEGQQHVDEEGET